jgi:hypothetical protein
MNENTKEVNLSTPGNDASPPQGESMTPNADTTIGDLVTAVFDEAAHYRTDLREVSQIATQAVTRLLRRARRRSDVIDAIRGVISDGCRLPAYGTPVPVSAQIRVAVYAAASSRSQRRSTGAHGSCSLGRSHDLQRS